MVKLHLGQKYWIRSESGLVDTSFLRFHCQWFKCPRLGLVMSISRFYKSMDTDIRLPMQSYVVFAAICVDVSRMEFDETVSRVYHKKKADRGARDAFESIAARNHVLTCIFQDEWSGETTLQEVGGSLQSNVWDGGDVGDRGSKDIQALVDSLNDLEEWKPSLRHPSWDRLSPDRYN